MDETATRRQHTSDSQHTREECPVGRLGISHASPSPSKRETRFCFSIQFGGVHFRSVTRRAVTGGLERSKQAAVLEVVLDDDVSDGVKHELNVVGVGGAREVRVHFLRLLLLVQILELVANEC